MAVKAKSKGAAKQASGFGMVEKDIGTLSDERMMDGLNFALSFGWKSRNGG